MPGAQKKLSPDSGSSEEGEFQCVRRGFQGAHEAPAGFIKRVDLASRGERGGACMGLVRGQGWAGALMQEHRHRGGQAA